MNPASNIKDHTDLALELAQEIKPLLAGRGPEIQSAALVELLSIFLAGHPPELREEILEQIITSVRAMTEVNARILRGEGARHRGH